MSLYDQLQKVENPDFTELVAAVEDFSKIYLTGVPSEEKFVRAAETIVALAIEAVYGVDAERIMIERVGELVNLIKDAIHE
jgi:hypothetical protein